MDAREHSSIATYFAHFRFIFFHLKDYPWVNGVFHHLDLRYGLFFEFFMLEMPKTLSKSFFFVCVCVQNNPKNLLKCCVSITYQLYQCISANTSDISANMHWYYWECRKNRCSAAISANIWIHVNKERLSFLQMYGVSFCSNVSLSLLMWASPLIVDHNGRTIFFLSFY